MNAARVQEIHQAIVLHFNTEGYNFLRYNGKIRSKKTTIFAEKLAKRLRDEKETIMFFVSNQLDYFQENQKINTFIGNFCNHESLNILEKEKAYMENFSYYSIEEIKTLFSLGKNLTDFAEISNLLLTKKISYRTAANFLVHLNLYDRWKPEIDPLQEEIFKFLVKLSDFVLIEKKNYYKAIQKAKASLI